MLHVADRTVLITLHRPSGEHQQPGSEAILAALPQRPDFCVVQVNTDQAIYLGNCGRVDVAIRVAGKASHSSAPEQGLSAIDGAHEVISRLRRLSWPEQLPLLGGRHAVVYKLRYEPLALHTLPSDAELVVDRHLLPGDPDAATAKI